MMRRVFGRDPDAITIRADEPNMRMKIGMRNKIESMVGRACMAGSPEGSSEVYARFDSEAKE
jgi:hypothetical protein